MRGNHFCMDDLLIHNALKAEKHDLCKLSIRCLLFRILNDENRSKTKSNNEDVEDSNNRSDVVAPNEADSASGSTESG